METIGVRELQQHASAVLRRVERGEELAVSNRGRVVAVLSPPTVATGWEALVASGRVTLARERRTALPDSVKASRRSADALDELRSDRT